MTDGAVDRVVGRHGERAGRPPVEARGLGRGGPARGGREAAKSRTLRGNFGDDELPALDISEGDFTRLSFQPRPTSR